MAPADDPFACFGDSSSSDDDDECDEVDDDDDMDRARRLVERHNDAADARRRRRSTTRASPPAVAATTTKTSSSSSSRSFESSREDQSERASLLPWPDVPPSYLGPMSLRDDLEDEGGGRGYVASSDLPPGTLVLVETPLVDGWSDDQRGRRLGLESIRFVLDGDDANFVVRCMEGLHPRRERVNVVLGRRRRRRRRDPPREEEGGEAATTATSEVPPDESSSSSSSDEEAQIASMMDTMDRDADLVDGAKSLVSYAYDKSVTNSDGSPLDVRDVMRMLLVLRYNGFDSGLYLHFSMFNHAEDPNCIKFRPAIAEEGGGDDDDAIEIADRRRNYSEARTTRHVRAGEALTLHYLEDPREMSHATRRWRLWDQHRFDIGDEVGYGRFLDVNSTKTGRLYNDNDRGHMIFESELVRGKFPPSTREGNVLDDASNDRDDGRGGDYVPTTLNIERSLDELEGLLVELGSSDADGTHFDRAVALELTIVEMIAASKSALGNDKHILLSRCYRLHLDVVEMILRLTHGQSVELIARSIPSAASLLESRRLRLGNDHPDVARTYHDLAMGIRALLSNSPRRLFSLKLEGMSTLDDCLRMEHRCRFERDRIDGLYPRDVDDILESVRRK
ncbi:hypothetical protein ACHAW5_003794 [Stephanodiscus triporus]|uniref:SET domain-containing protein n=1 Tax=Stephanodiscus triporus TaxID=2934178 RepID=A0ABD3P1Z6_9STRA